MINFSCVAIRANGKYPALSTAEYPSGLRERIANP